MMKPTDHELLEQYVDGILAERDLPRLEKLLRMDSEARAALRSLAALDFGLQNLADREIGALIPQDEQYELTASAKYAHIHGARIMKNLAAILMVVAALILVAFLILPRFQQGVAVPLEHEQPSDAAIAQVVGLSGPLQWTGDGGRVHYDLQEGMELSGGTVEGLTPNSWFELEFNDGSLVTISGASMLTFSDNGQKELHLKDGGLSSNVMPQPADAPMLIYTRSAKFEVLGTQFEIDAQLASTTLRVNEGIVRAERFSDGKTVVVPANHRVVAAADREMEPEPVPIAVSLWKSHLESSPTGLLGAWSPESEQGDPSLKAIPFTLPNDFTIYATSFVVYDGENPPVFIEKDSRLRVKGLVETPGKIFFGVTVWHATGDFGGRFQTTLPQEDFFSGQEFEVELSLNDFQLDPSLKEYKEHLPSDPFHLVVESIWCHSLDKPAGLEIYEVELIPPE